MLKEIKMNTGLTSANHYLIPYQITGGISLSTSDRTCFFFILVMNMRTDSSRNLRSASQLHVKNCRIFFGMALPECLSQIYPCLLFECNIYKLQIEQNISNSVGHYQS